jgi:hypothetical protein
MAEISSNAQGADATVIARQMRQTRRDRVLMISLVEMLSILVFVAMAYAMVTNTERVDLNRQFKSEVLKLRSFLNDREEAIKKLTLERDKWRQEAEALHIEYTGTPIKTTPDDVLPLPRPPSLGKGAGDGRVRCAFPAERLFTIEMHANGFYRAIPAWRSTEDAQARALPGVAAILAEGKTAEVRFAQLANAIAQQAPPEGAKGEACRYVVTADDKLIDSKLEYKRQMEFLTKYFRTNPTRVGR